MPWCGPKKTKDKKKKEIDHLTSGLDSLTVDVYQSFKDKILKFFIISRKLKRKESKPEKKYFKNEFLISSSHEVTGNNSNHS